MKRTAHQFTGSTFCGALLLAGLWHLFGYWGVFALVCLGCCVVLGGRR